MSQQAKTRPTQRSRDFAPPKPVQTLLDHLRELRRRLLFVVASLIVCSIAVYPAYNTIISVLVRPLGKEQLVYLTPVGGFNFAFKICLYAGILLSIPIILYHIYKFLEPLMNIKKQHSVMLYITASSCLALVGIVFAYFISLPEALKFLTNFKLNHVTAMLTVDSYLNFVIHYVLGFAILAQIPLIMTITNSIRPIPPKKLFSFERFVILGAFVIGALLAPTPDVTNQTIMAIPIVLMYQIGAVSIWLKNRKSQERELVPTQVARSAPINTAKVIPRQLPSTHSQPTLMHAQKAQKRPQQKPMSSGRGMDIITSHQPQQHRAARPSFIAQSVTKTQSTQAKPPVRSQQFFDIVTN